MISKKQWATRLEIIRYCKKWEKVLDLPGVEVTWSFIEDYHHDDKVGDEAAWLAADTIVEEPYRQATIRFYMPACARMTSKDLEHVVLHEYGHILIARLEVRAKPGKATANATEYTIECITRALIKTDRKKRK